jgi:hypothetical protein
MAPKAASKGGCSQDWPPYKSVAYRRLSAFIGGQLLSLLARQ